MVLFVFPSSCEGSATVYYEALASGLPVVTVRAAGSVVLDRIDGFSIAPWGPEALAGWVKLFACDQKVPLAMDIRAKERARGFRSARYGESLVSTPEPLLEES